MDIGLSLTQPEHLQELGASVAELMSDIASFSANAPVGFEVADASITFTIRDGEPLAGTWKISAERV